VPVCPEAGGRGQGRPKTPQNVSNDTQETQKSSQEAVSIALGCISLPQEDPKTAPPAHGGGINRRAPPLPPRKVITKARGAAGDAAAGVLDIIFIERAIIRLAQKVSTRLLPQTGAAGLPPEEPRLWHRTSSYPPLCVCVCLSSLHNTHVCMFFVVCAVAACWVPKCHPFCEPRPPQDP